MLIACSLCRSVQTHRNHACDHATTFGQALPYVDTTQRTTVLRFFNLTNTKILGTHPSRWISKRRCGGGATRPEVHTGTRFRELILMSPSFYDILTSSTLVRHTHRGRSAYASGLSGHELKKQPAHGIGCSVTNMIVAERLSELPDFEEV